MRYQTLGGTGLLVSEICLGTMTFGGPGAGIWSNIGQVGQADADAIVTRALDAGVNFIDTADVYAQSLSEEITGQAMKNSGRKRTDIVLATKCTGATGTGPNDRGSSRGHIMDAVKQSLKRLGTDYIDLYQIHGQDNLTPVEETMRALDDLVRQGHVRYIGVSSWAAWRLAKALGVSDKHGWSRFVSLQAYLHHRRPRPRTRTRAVAQGREGRTDGVEPAGRRPAQRQVQPRWLRPGRVAPRQLRLPAGRP